MAAFRFEGTTKDGQKTGESIIATKTKALDGFMIDTRGGKLGLAEKARYNEYMPKYTVSYSKKLYSIEKMRNYKTYSAEERRRAVRLG